MTVGVKRRAVMLAGAAAVAGGVGGWRLLSGRGVPVRVPASDTGGTVVVRTDLAARERFGGTLGYAGDWSIVHPGPSGVLTSVPPPGAVAGRGEPLYEVDGHPVRLLIGARPVWRGFGPGMARGLDVRQLEENLAAMGYLAGDPGTRFTAATRAAVGRWQSALRVERTGRLPLGSIVFAPQALRVTGAPTPLGDRTGGAPVVRASSTRQVITVSLPTARRGSVAAGSPVLVTVPGGAPVPATVTEVGRVAVIPSGLGSQATVTITAELAAVGAAAGLDQVPVQVSLTTGQRNGVLAVPVTALTAAAGTGYEVTVHDGGTSRRIAVRPGLFDELSGLIEVDGVGLVEGMTVQVPA